MEEKRQKKRKMKNFLLGAGLCALVIFVIITSIVLNSKSKELQKLKELNDVAKPEEVVRII